MVLNFWQFHSKQLYEFSSNKLKERWLIKVDKENNDFEISSLSITSIFVSFNCYFLEILKRSIKVVEK